MIAREFEHLFTLSLAFLGNSYFDLLHIRVFYMFSVLTIFGMFIELIFSFGLPTILLVSIIIILLFLHRSFLL